MAVLAGGGRYEGRSDGASSVGARWSLLIICQPWMTPAVNRTGASWGHTEGVHRDFGWQGPGCWQDCARLVAFELCLWVMTGVRMVVLAGSVMTLEQGDPGVLALTG